MEELVLCGCRNSIRRRRAPDERFEQEVTSGADRRRSLMQTGRVINHRDFLFDDPLEAFLAGVGPPPRRVAR